MAPSATRPLSKAGSWYKGDPDALDAELDKFLAAVPDQIDENGLPIPGARVIIAPHAGYSYSGPTAAWAYKALDLSQAKRVFLLGPSHTFYLRGCAITSFEKYATPFGDLTVDQKIANHIRDELDIPELPVKNDVAEHCLELHLPFLFKRIQQTFDSPDKYPTVIPMLIGDNNKAEEKEVGKWLAPYLKDPENAFVVSSDFCHWGSHFDYTVYAPDGTLSSLQRLRQYSGVPDGPQIHETIKMVDDMAIEAIKTGRHSDFYDNLKQTKNTVCGRHPIGVTMAALEELGEGHPVFKFVQYQRSSMVTDPSDSSVSYVSAYAVYGYVSLSGADGAHDDEYDLGRGRLTDSTNDRYGGRQNPFDQRDDSPAGGYGAPPRPPQQGFGSGPSPYGGSRYNNGPAMGRDQYGTNVEMESLAQNAGGFGQSSDPNAILNECRSIDQGVDQIEANLNQLRMLQERTLTDADTSASSSTARQLDALSSETMTMYRSLTERVRQVKSTPEGQTPKNSPQVGRVDRRLKGAIQQYQQVESQFRKRTQDQMARQYRIVRPDADEQEVRAAVEDAGAGAQIFQQAVMQSGRQAQANSVLSAVQDRQAALEKIEQQILELAQLFQDMDVLVVQQEAAVTQIEQKGEEVVENLDKGNQEIGVAVETARKTRKKKWWCLGICVLIVAIIAAVVAIYFAVIKPGQAAAPAAGKRDLSLEAIHNSVPIDIGTVHPQILKTSRIMRRIVQPGATWDPNAVQDSAVVARVGGKWDMPAVRN
ncbi:snare domain containing protein [Colletotrichum karsti]|uniref:Snare domain containing protein n=1 Tax=Colletotrichum karsti TaxID=1095194 RepID=A0A9P6LL26_9PEZI|nr:snare domain containing protein [Colletotrichum karsti]KAF9876750.1 snare domain containing protein [Colletotrichum karsti]